MKIALAQINPATADIKGNRLKILNAVEKAAEAKADLVVFPELAVIGWPPCELLKSEKLIAESRSSVELIAKQSGGIGIICGFPEACGSALYNSAAFMSGGKIISVHRKTALSRYNFFDEAVYFKAGTEHLTADFKGQRLFVTCNDILTDSNVIGHILNSGADAVICISALPYVFGKREMRFQGLKEKALSTGKPVAFVNQAGGSDSLIFDGGSTLLNGKIPVAWGGSFKESLCIGDTSSVYRSAVDVGEPDDMYKALVLGLRDYAHKCGFSSCVLGLSGGIDSAVTCCLAVEAFGAENVLGLIMPSMYSSEGSVRDALELAKNLGVETETIPIHEAFKSFLNSLSNIFSGKKPDVTEENLQARIRGTLLMAVSNKTGRLLLNTGNKSELAMGYCTLYGDMNGGIAVLGDVLKTSVYKLAAYINKSRILIPISTITKPPSAELSENQKDEDSLPPYDILDGILKLLLDEKLSTEEIVARGFAEETTEQVVNAMLKSEYKRRQAPPCLRISESAFGLDIKLPTAFKYKP